MKSSFITNQKEKEVKDIKDREDMPTYTCEKCARTFSQKGHYTAHLNKKIDCATKTAIKEIAQKIVDEEKGKEEEVKDTDNKEFNPENYNLFELQHYFPQESIIHLLVSVKHFDGVIQQLQMGASGLYIPRSYHDVIVLEEGLELVYFDSSNRSNVIHFTHNDTKYFPICSFSQGSFFLSYHGKDVNFRAKTIYFMRKPHHSLQFPTTNRLLKSSIVKGKLFFVVEHLEDFSLEKIEHPIDNPYDRLLSEYPDADGIIHPLNYIHNIHKIHNIHNYDILILEEDMTVTLTDRNEKDIELTYKEIKYVPLYALRNTRIRIRFNENNEENENENKKIYVITFTTEILSKLFTSYRQGLITFENGMATLKD